MAMRLHLLCTMLFLFLLIIPITEAKIVIVVSVDWEGRNLTKANLDAIKKFRSEFPEIMMQHFLNPAYYTENIEPISNPAAITRKIKSVLLPGDEQGLHIHAWKNLFTKAKAHYQSSPNFFDSSDDEAGATVPLWAYTKEELSAVFALGIRILTSNGFKRATSFRAGGWQASSIVIEALAENKITLDSSAVPLAHLTYWHSFNLGKWVQQLWPNTTLFSQPFFHESTNVIELPNNGCLADYVTGEGMLGDFKRLSKTATASRSDLYYSIGFHQETAAEYLPRLRKAILLIRDFAKQEKIAYEFATFPLSFTSLLSTNH
ncbi:MAG: hypothetical protein HQK50_15310 [Oligoflexia bacterium]|nr:hypothetical protein [Oligoflexia bacterium]MBF0366942.1 hypothetical protein [Oligoflexia bacterium]